MLTDYEITTRLIKIYQKIIRNIESISCKEVMFLIQ